MTETSCREPRSSEPAAPCAAGALPMTADMAGRRAAHHDEAPDKPRDRSHDLAGERTPSSHAAGGPASQQASLDDALAEARLRDEGMRSASRNTWTPWKRAAEEALEVLAHSGHDFTADDLIAEVGLPVASSKNAVGPLFGTAAKQGLIRKVGYRISERPARRGGVVAIWRGAGDDA